MAIRLMTLAEIEQEYNISQRTLMRYMQQRRLQGVKVAGKWYIPEIAIKQLFLDGLTASRRKEINATEIILKPSARSAEAVTE